MLVVLGVAVLFCLWKVRAPAATGSATPAATATVRHTAAQPSTPAGVPPALAGTLPVPLPAPAAAPAPTSAPPLAATAAGPASVPQAPPDSTAGLPTLASREEPLEQADGVRRLRLVKADSKYPYWRVEETFRRDAGTGRLRLQERRIAVADHACVQLRSDAPPGAIEEIASRHGLVVRKTSAKSGLYLLAAPKAELDTLPGLLASLTNEPLVRFAEPDNIVSAIATVPNDPSFGQLWGLNNTGQSGGTPDADIDAPEAWDSTVGSTGVVVGVIDTGVDYTHPDLAANIWSNPLEVVNGLDDDGNGLVDDVRGWDFKAEDNDPMDENGHGTHCSGTIAGVGNNGVGVAGVNWRCRILPLRFLDADGRGYTSDAVEALYYVIWLRQHGVNIRLTSNSWGGSPYEQVLRDAIAANGEAGLLFVAAAGNNWDLNNDLVPAYPASYPESNIIAVAATDRNDGLAGFSHYGAVSVDLGAPGVSIYSTVPGGYGLMDGTSMAAPHVSGVAALLAGLAPGADWIGIRRAILTGVDLIPSLAGRTVTGGRLNAFKAIRALAWIHHTPLADTYVTNAPYAVDALITPTAFIDTNSVRLFWNTDGSTSTFASASFTLVGTELWRAWIPAQPFGTEVRYWISATTSNGIVMRNPTNAPAALNHFRVAPPRGFIVSGSPDDYGTVVPAYGLYVHPSGVTLTADASPTSVPDGLARWRCSGWRGMGSVPASGTSNALAFTIDRASALEWQWTRQYALQQTASVSGLVSATTWWDLSSEAASATAPSTRSVRGTNFAFAFWSLDGLRQPDATNVAINPLTSVMMDTSHVAQAVYRPATEDLDGDGMADWWELFFFGSTNSNPAEDSDGDGVPNLGEYLDRSLPTSSNSIPAAPVIVHTALADPQAAPAPYPVDAVVTDNFSVAAVTLAWSRNGGAAVLTNMAVAGSGGLYRALIPAPGTNGDSFTYSIVAADPAGHVVTNGPHTFRVDYAILVVSPSDFGTLVLAPASSETRLLVVSNTGSANLTATVDFNAGGVSNNVEQGANRWTHSGAADLWTVSSLRSWSPSNAWYCGNPATAKYFSGMQACLDSPPLYAAPDTALTFRHWIKCELDVNPGRGGHSWDGGRVEVSTNGGAAFAPITPVGGYPYLISGWGYVGEAWPEGTPCFAGTGGWQQVTFNLGAYAGQWIVLRWHFASDGNTVAEGWYVDDMVAAGAATNDWLTLGPANLVVAPNASASVTVTVSSASIVTGDRGGLVRVLNNSPADPEHAVPIRMSVRSPPGVTMRSAAQTSTDGQGLVTLTNTVFDIDGDPCALEYLWSTNAGATWQTNWVTSATAAVGVVQCTRLGTQQVTAVQTRSGTNAVTNTVAALWDSTSPVASLGLSTDTWVRCRAWDGLFWSAPHTSQPFLVDNLPPSAPPNLASTSHALNSWSTNRAVAIAWCAAVDEGGGVAGYRYAMRTQVGGFEQAAQTIATTVTNPPINDGTNWEAAVQAFDVFGNVGPTAATGQFWIDTTPPSAAGAVITLDHSPNGVYVLGGTVGGTWTGFSDGGSGIAGYYVSFANAGTTTNGLWTPTPPASLSGAVPDATNMVYVWARDAVGLIGSAKAAPVLVLSTNGDWDADGSLNAQEEIAATDARNPQSVLHVESLAAADATGALFVLRWQGATNRLYSVARRGGLLAADPDWTSAPDFTRVPGIDGFMSYTDRPADIIRFYRLSVEQP